MTNLPPAKAEHLTQWTILRVVEWGSEYLKQRRFDESRLHCELLLGHVLGMTRVQLYMHFDRPLAPHELADFKSLFKRRLTHEPLQYILGETEFMGLPLYVNSTVLIPRPETEILVERIVDNIKEKWRKPVSILDVGTGSGNIPIALANSFPDARILSVDVSAEALETARRNLDRHSVVNVELRCHDILQELSDDEHFDVIVSNPPYVSLAEHEGLAEEVRDFEPTIATTDGGDGLLFIRRLAELSMTRLHPRGLIAIEIGHGQQDDVVDCFHSAGLTDIQVFEDYARIPRIVCGVRAG